MRPIIVLWLLFPFMGMSQTKNVFNSSRYFPKVDKVLEFEKALAAHSQKYHSGNGTWRVYEIQSGPDAGGYQVTEGPNSWEQLDGRGNLNTEHSIDWNKNVTIYLTERGSSFYEVFQDTLSTVSLTEYSDNININHWYPKIGWGSKINDVIRKMKNTWLSDGESVAVYTSSSSGPAQFIIVTRYKQGLKERTTGFRKPLKERFEAANGEGSYAAYLDVVREYLTNAWSELLFYRADLSSK